MCRSVCVWRGKRELQLNSFEVHMKGNSGEEKKRCNPWNTPVLDINKHSEEISKGRLLSGNLLMCRWEIRKQMRCREVWRHVVFSHTHMYQSTRHSSFMFYRARISFCMFVCFCLPAFPPVNRLSVLMRQREWNHVQVEFPQAVLISSLQLALSCIWQTPVEFFGRNVKCLRLN